MHYGILGPLEVSVDGVTLDVGGRKQRAVLAVLLTDLNRVVSLDRLIDELWGDDPPARAIGTLQAYISNLRRVLEPDRAPRTPPQVLATQPPGYVLRADPADVDAVRFETMTGEAGDLLDAGDPAAARRLLDEALALWRGPALADFAGETFARTEAMRLENLRELALETRAAAVLALGDHAGVVGELERLVAHHPLRERLWELLMLALYRSGRQAEALRAFGQARKILKDELGVSPGPTLQALENDILAQSAALAWKPPAAPAAAAGDDDGPAGPARFDPPAQADGGPVGGEMPAVPAVIDLRTAADRVVGRDEPLGVLADAWRTVRSGQTCVAVVTGAAGVGKTSLIDAFADTARAEGARVARGRAVDEQGAPALWPWTQVLRGLLAERDDGSVADIVGDARAELAPLVPGLAPPAAAAAGGGAGAAPVRTTDVDARLARFRLYDAVTGVVRRAAAVEPLVMVLDDAQWADLTSIRLLEFVAGELRDVAVLVVVGCRDDASPEPAMTECLATIARQPSSLRITLRGLDQASVHRYIAQVASVEAADAVAAEVHRRTGGNAFFVTELVRLLQSGNRLDAEGAAVALPAGVRDVIRQRIARLPADTQSLLVVAAVIGQTFTLDALLGVSQLDDDRLFELLEPALVTGVVVESAELGRYEFSHALVRDTLYASLTAVRRARMHATVARTLETAADHDRSRGTTAAELARHWHAAGDQRKAVAASVRAGQQAAALAAFDDALEHFERALSLWDAVVDAEAAAGCSTAGVLGRAARAACYAGRDSRAVELASASASRYDRAADPVGAAAALVRLGRYAWLGGDTATALRAHEEAVALLAPLPPSVEQARALATHAQALMLRAHYGEAVARCREAIEVAQQTGARAAEGHARNTLGGSLAALGHVDEGLAELEEARRIAFELDRPDDLCRALVNRSTRLISCGRVQEGVAAALSAMETARRTGMVRVYGTFVAANAGFALIRMGRWDEAEAVIADALREPAPGVSAVEVRLARADLALHRGQLAEAAHWLDDVESRIARLDSMTAWGQLLICRAELALVAGNTAAVRRFVDRGIELAKETDELACVPELVALGARAAADEAEAARSVGDDRVASSAASEADRLLAILQRRVAAATADGSSLLPAVRGHVLAAEAEQLRAAGRDGRERLVAAARCWDEVGYAALATRARQRAEAAPGLLTS